MPTIYSDSIQGLGFYSGAYDAERRHAKEIVD